MGRTDGYVTTDKCTHQPDRDNPHKHTATENAVVNQTIALEGAKGDKNGRSKFNAKVTAKVLEYCDSEDVTTVLHDKSIEVTVEWKGGVPELTQEGGTTKKAKTKAITEGAFAGGGSADLLIEDSATPKGSCEFEKSVKLESTVTTKLTWEVTAAQVQGHTNCSSDVTQVLVCK